MKKLFSRTGESLVETLVAVLLISLIFVFLADAVVTAARINAQVSNADTAFTRELSSETGTISVYQNGSGVLEESVAMHTTGNGYVYYE